MSYNCYDFLNPLDDYLCVGSVETDFPELCTLLGVKNIPPVFTKQPSPPLGEDGCETDMQADEGDAGKRVQTIKSQNV